MNRETKIEWPIEEETDEKGNEYFTCPYCEGNGIACKGSTMDMGDNETPMMVQIEPDWPCQICDESGSIKVGSEAHFFLMYNTVFDIINNSFDQEIIDNMPSEKFKKFWVNLEGAFHILKPFWLEANPNA